MRRGRFALRTVLGLLLLWCLPGCGERPPEVDALRQAEPTGGPKIDVDLERRPFAEIPWPNDLLTQRDSTSPTGRRLDLSEDATTERGRDVRRALNDKIGWGLLQPITVSFDAPLDIRNIYDRHRDDVPDFEDDVAYLVNVDPRSEGYGEFRLLDFGRGNYPVTHAEPGSFFANDPRSEGTNLLYETIREVDEDGDGVLDPIEDTDDDGTWDRPNTLDPEGDPYTPRQLLEFYERETHTLVMRPVEPLRPKTTYAVVLTKALRGTGGAEVESPFPGINHARQTETLEPLREILPGSFPDRFTRRLRDVQFAWSFTTGDPTREMKAIRAGLYGYRSLSRLNREYPARLKLLHDPEGKESAGEETEAGGPLTFRLDDVQEFVIPLVGNEVGSESASAVEKQLEHVDYVVSGSFMSPYFLGDSNGLAEDGADSTLSGTNPQVMDEHFDIDLSKGRARVRPAEVTFNCAVPEPTEFQKPPFPVVVYSHAISSTRLEMLLFAGAFARLGLATCAIDAAGHGLEIPDDIRDDLGGLLESLGFPHLETVVEHHRARDVRNDGTPDSGGDYFTSDLLHTRSMIRQTTIDQMQFIRILRSFQGEKRWPDSIDRDDPYVEARGEAVAGWDQDGDGEGELRGDFNGDGTVDFGGSQEYAAFGTSLGAIQTGLLGSLEPAVTAASTNAGGGGLADIAIRSTIGHVRNAVILPIFGPLVVGEPESQTDGGASTTTISFVLPNGTERTRVPIARAEDLEDGDRIILRNETRDPPFAPRRRRISTATVREGAFRLGLAADALGSTARRALLGFDPANDVQDDITGCETDETCRGSSCPPRHHCSDEGECIPVHACLREFRESDQNEGELGEALSRHTARQPERFGDRFVIEIRNADGEVKRRISEFQVDAVYQNIVYPRGADLAALHAGWGLQRQTPPLRRFLDRAHLLLESADPAIYAPEYFRRPNVFAYESPEYRHGATNLLAVGTVGDQTVPINTALTFARSAGLLETRRADSRYGKTANQFLIDRYVYEGIADLDRFPSHPGTLFDPDDLDRGMFTDPERPELQDPNLDAERPLRSTRDTRTGVSALRLPYLQTDGAHTFNAPRPEAPFDVPTFMTHQVAWYLASGGTDLRDATCLQSVSFDCPFFAPGTYGGPDLANSN